MTQHTPGPWTIRRELTAEAHSIEIDAPSWAAIATVVVRVNGDSSPSGEANARLIAAAPTLAALLSACCEYVEKFGELSEAPTDSDCWDVLEDARNLMAQIAGEPAPYPERAGEAPAVLTDPDVQLMPENRRKLGFGTLAAGR